ncbi:cell division protein FtsA [Aquibacillus sediminis]|uniref:cell division protein FtsA n=1 Tax=Aquibacillus sediminis TaxID=2574734 RepID=UPI0011094EDA|nr:cell division protein FtsA [Aquibacillus sediminis]
MTVTEQIFALDIGTRTVVGLILQKTKDNYQLIDYCIQEHHERSMLDGQIHDVVSVADVIISVKQKLEQKHGPLTSVCVAAAGRALKTKRTTITKSVGEQPLMNKEDILFLEFSAVQNAQHDLAVEEENNSRDHYYCVGYSVLQYKLDDRVIGSLIDQQGDKVEVEIIATFLPKVVVESLIAALHRADLEMEALTLEPIAAINVLIPPSMRRLNVALVDIGAGTSDIAITEQGTVTAYGMVPKAGDEITEAVSDHYLLDFPQAELVKRQIKEDMPATSTDILGFEQVIDYQDLVAAVTTEIDGLVETIANEIIRLNNKPPKAVMLVGGGSMTPEITNRLASKLQLPNNRVAIRGIDAIQSLEQIDTLPIGPTFVTPIGIAIAAKQNPIHYISVTVNHRTVRLFDMKELTIGDCLLAAGIDIDKLYGKPGMAYIIHVNGRDITLPGTYGQSPQVVLNGVDSTIDSPIQDGDEILVVKGEDGKEPIVKIKHIIGDMPNFSVKFNDQNILIRSNVFVNGQEKNADYIVHDHDTIEVKSTKTIEDFFQQIGQYDKLQQLGSFYLYVNQQKVILPYENNILINGNSVGISHTLKAEDVISMERTDQLPLEIVLTHLDLDYEVTLHVTFNNEPVTLTKQKLSIYRDGHLLTTSDYLKRGDSIKTMPAENEPFIFQDIFRFVSLDLSDVHGNVQILKNNQPASFTDPLSENDSITIKW